MAKKGNDGASAFVALMRGVNVGGKNKLPMKELVEIFTDAGCTDVRSYIQSGNVVYRASAALSKKIPAVVAAAVEKRFGFRSPVITRSADELATVLRVNPYLARGVEPTALHVAFLSAAPAAAAIGKLDPARSVPDEFIVRGSEIFLHCPNGLGRSKLTNEWFDKGLSATSTIRNWRTVCQLVELAGLTPA